MRYMVAENQHGYELHSGVLRFAVIDTEPDMVSTYSPAVRGRVLSDIKHVTPILRNATKFRQVAFAMHREDAENMAASMNARARVLA